MAGAPKPEFPPLLAHGFHDFRLATLRILCVDNFQGSITRPLIMTGFEAVVGQLNGLGLRMEIWVDGSFMTQKLNPEDVDFAVRVEESNWRAADIKQKSTIKWVNETDLKPQYHCDSYAFVELSPASSIVRGDWEWDRSLWLRQFGFSRTDERKGLAVLKLPFIIP